MLLGILKVLNLVVQGIRSWHNRFLILAVTEAKQNKSYKNKKIRQLQKLD